jgi:2'-5' RNA ligase
MRIFIAVELNSEVKNKINEVVSSIKNYNLPVKWVEKDNLHITLKFLGEVKENKINDLTKLLKNEVEKNNRFTLKVEGLGAFPNNKKPRVIWVGTTDGKDKICDIAQKLEESLPKNGFGKKEEKPFSSHITIGRVKEVGKLSDFSTVLPKLDNLSFGVVEVNSINLMKSALTPKGPIYEVVAKISLAE